MGGGGRRDGDSWANTSVVDVVCVSRSCCVNSNVVLPGSNLGFDVGAPTHWAPTAWAPTRWAPTAWALAQKSPKRVGRNKTESPDM
eukprot:5524937-Prymnesium_polylepis.1